MQCGVRSRAGNLCLDPLAHIQVTVRRRYRQALRDQGADSPEAETWLRPLPRSINALDFLFQGY
jgi:phosphoenolpyruvate carboxylase